jgi:hypothetical protein
VSSGLTICSAKQVCVLSAVSSQTHPSRIFISPSFVVLCCVLCAVCKRNAKAGAAPNSGLRLLRIMLRLPRTQTLLGAVLLSSAALVCASSGLCSVCSRADTVFFSLHWFSCFRSLPPPSLARMQVCCHPHSYRCHPRTYTFRLSTQALAALRTYALR